MMFSPNVMEQPKPGKKIEVSTKARFRPVVFIQETQDQWRIFYKSLALFTLELTLHVQIHVPQKKRPPGRGPGGR
jgi:hypothetical protein